MVTQDYDWAAADRLGSIERWKPLLIARRPDLDELTACARHAFHAPMAFVSVLEPSGLSVVAPTGTPELAVPPRHAFCRHVVERQSVFVVLNATASREFANNPFVLDPPYKRFYAGAPIHLPDGHVLGAFCVIDTEPRFKFSAEDEAALSRFARLAERLVFEGAHSVD